MAFLDETGATILADEVKTYVGNTAVAKEAGKGLSTNDYTTTEKNKLSNLNETVLTKLGESADGNLTFDDKKIGANIMVDQELSDTSTNPLQNKVVKSALDEKLSTSGDSKDVVSSFSSNDSTSETTIWTDVPALNSSEKHSSIFNKISTMFKNIRYLYKMLGTADISTLGEGANIGTVTGAISKLNSEINNYDGNLPYIKFSWELGKTPDSEGNIYILDGKNVEFLLSVGISKTMQNYYVEKFFVNNYGMWYATIKKRDGTPLKEPIDIVAIYTTA